MARRYDERYSEPLEDAEEVNLGPDERDMDLIDGTWEGEYYAGRKKRRDWQSVGLAIGLLIVIALLLPGVLAVTG